MNVYQKWNCRNCKAVFRSEEHIPVQPNETPMQALLFVTSRGNHKNIKPHQCSPRIAGVADFAGVEFSEDE